VTKLFNKRELKSNFNPSECEYFKWKNFFYLIGLKNYISFRIQNFEFSIIHNSLLKTELILILKLGIENVLHAILTNE